MLETFLTSSLTPFVVEVAKGVFINLTSEGIKEIFKKVHSNWKNSTPEEVFKTILSTAFFTAFVETLRGYGVRNIHGNEEIVKKLLQLEGINPKLEEFDFKNFSRNGVLNQIWEYYKRILLSDENRNEELKKVITENGERIFGDITLLAENHFYRILDLEKSNEDIGVSRLKKWIEEESRYSSVYKYKRKLYEVAKEFEEPILKHEKVFKIPLKDLYVEPSFRIYEKNLLFKERGLEKENPPRCQEEDRIGGERGGFYFYTPRKVRLTEFIPDLLRGKNPFEFLKPPSPKMVLLLGYPGEGKTSFTKKLIYDYVNNKLNISQQAFLIRFRDINEEEDGYLLKSALETINNHIKRKYGIEIKSWEGKFLILDGLDEYVVPQNLTNEQISQILRKFYSLIKDKEKTFILITSRYIPTEVLNKAATDFQTLVLELREFDGEDITQYLNNFERALEKLEPRSIGKFKIKLRKLKEYLKTFYTKKNSRNYTEIYSIYENILGLEDKHCHLKELINQPRNSHS